MDFKSRLRKLWNKDDHEHFAEMCALFTAGSLTADELSELNAHLLNCMACAQLLRSYRAVAKRAMPLVAPLEGAAVVQTDKAWSVENAKKQLLNRIESARATERVQLVVPMPAISRRPGMFTPGRQTLLGAATVIILALLAGFTYRVGELRGRKAADNASLPTLQELRPSQIPAADLHLLEQRLAEQSHEVNRLERELKSQQAAISESRSSQEKLLHDAREQGSRITALSTDKVALSTERDALARKLQETQLALVNAQERLVMLQEEHSRQTMHTASLQKRVDELSTELKESQTESAAANETALGPGSDIRDLMGARELYIADVFDVDRNGKPQKAFGRVFYTGGKSLIFYAFDLDKRPDAREANTFQAWGRRGPGDKHPLSMGAFSLDDAANRRWVLRFDNPKVLAQLDAVFVTVEPRNGGHKPSGKQLLFASLRIPPNHP